MGMQLFFSILAILIHTTEAISQQKDTLYFQVEGSVKGINGKKITLDIPIYTVDKRFTTVVANDSFYFQGKLFDSIVFARILMDEDITNPTGGYTNFPFMLSPGTTKISFTANKTNDAVIRYRFVDLTIEKGEVGIEYNKYNTLFGKEVFKGMSYRPDSLYLDSMYRFVFPQRRRVFEQLYASYKDSMQQAYNKVKLLITLSQTDLYANQTPFITAADKAFIINSYQALAPLLRNHTEYSYIDSYFSNYKGADSLKFTDFELTTIDNKKIRVSSIIKKNKYTVLYFWWSGCIPCRQFHRKEKNNYTSLKSKNIEFVSINTDDIKLKWSDASKKDRIEWVNLFAGRFSPMVPAYNVQSFPTKIVINSKFEIIPINFSSMKELLMLD